MSKWRNGNYDTGEPRHKYFRKTKHHYKSLIRKIMWIAQGYKDLY